MVLLTEKQLDKKINFIKDYIKANNAADGSTFDPNGNVSSKNIATLGGEINKDINIQIKRRLAYENIKKLWGKKTADEYLRQLKSHIIYTHDETNLAPYCVAVSMFPFLTDGLKPFGGDSSAPKHLSSFNGGFTNLIFALSSQFSGAVATVEYLTCFDYFARKDYGENYLQEQEDIIKQELQQVVYALNQPASARNYQSPFWNISIFDKHFFKGLFDNFYFPDGSKPKWESVNKLQKFFMRWFNEERKKALLTFPVVTAALLHDGKTLKDAEYKDFLAGEISRGNSFFTYISETVDSLSSCCRMRNYIADQIKEFSYSLGAGGVMSGSLNVISLNVNRFVQNCKKEYSSVYNYTGFDVYLCKRLKEQTILMQKFQMGFLEMFKDFLKAKMLIAYDGGFIAMNRQFLTIGINGIVESAEFLGLEVSNNKEYKEYVSKFMKTISDTNKETMEKYPDIKFNTEIVPGENLGVRFAKWDKEDGYFVPRDCYNSYLYKVEDESTTIIDKFVLHGEETTQYLDGGSALHLNLEQIPTKESAEKIMELAVKTGCPYYCINVKVTICNDCEYIDKRTLKKCSKCSSTNIDYATRIIGYLIRIKNFSGGRQIEESTRYYGNA